MVCSPDARSLRPPALLPAMTRAVGDQPGRLL